MVVHLRVQTIPSQTISPCYVIIPFLHQEWLLTCITVLQNSKISDFSKNCTKFWCELSEMLAQLAFCQWWTAHVTTERGCARAVIGCSSMLGWLWPQKHTIWPFWMLLLKHRFILCFPWRLNTKTTGNKPKNLALHNSTYKAGRRLLLEDLDLTLL